MPGQSILHTHLYKYIYNIYIYGIYIVCINKDMSFAHDFWSLGGLGSVRLSMWLIHQGLPEVTAGEYGRRSQYDPCGSLWSNSWDKGSFHYRTQEGRPQQGKVVLFFGLGVAKSIMKISERAIKIIFFDGFDSQERMRCADLLAGCTSAEGWGGGKTSRWWRGTRPRWTFQLQDMVRTTSWNRRSFLPFWRATSNDYWARRSDCLLAASMNRKVGRGIGMTGINRACFVGNSWYLLEGVRTQDLWLWRLEISA